MTTKHIRSDGTIDAATGAPNELICSLLRGASGRIAQLLSLADSHLGNAERPLIKEAAQELRRAFECLDLQTSRGAHGIDR